MLVISVLLGLIARPAAQEILITLHSTMLSLCVP